MSSAEQQRRAHRLVDRAVREGVLVPGDDCEHCGHRPGPGEPRLDAHHWLGYEWHVALVVEWLCKPCHASTHGPFAELDRLTPEELSKRNRPGALAAAALLTPKEQSRRSRAYWDRLTPEERAEHQRRAWESRRANRTPDELFAAMSAAAKLGARRREARRRAARAM